MQVLRWRRDAWNPRCRGGAMLGGLLVVALMPRVGLAGPLEAFAKLETEMERAWEAFDTAKEAAALKNGTTGTKEIAELPHDGRGSVLKKMDALVKRTWGKGDGLHIAVETLLWSVEIESEGTFGRFKRIAKVHPDAAKLTEALGALEYEYAGSAKPEQWITVLDKLLASSKEPVIRTSALHLKGVIQMQSHKLKDAKNTFDKVIKLAGESDLAESATGYLYEIDHLQVGMVAPDFVTKALDGEKVRLESLRGKTVLLNLWASW